MTLTTNGKNYIATNFGIDGCFVESGLEWIDVNHDGDRISSSGGTKNIVGRIVTDSVYASIEMVSPMTGEVTGIYTKDQLTTANDDETVTLSDALSIGDEDGGEGETQYCYTEPSTGEPDESGYVGTFEFVEGPTEDLTADLDISEIDMQQRFGDDPRFEMNHIKIKNTSDWSAYFAIQIKMWSGEQSICDPGGVAVVWTGVNRGNTEEDDGSISRWVRLVPIDGNAEEDIYADFYVPESVLGTHTICIYVWGNYDKDELYDELEEIGET